MESLGKAKGLNEIMHQPDVSERIKSAEKEGMFVDYEFLHQFYEDIMRQMLEGFQGIHKNGILHLDIKPENILIIDSSFPKLIKQDNRLFFERVSAPKVYIIDFGIGADSARTLNQIWSGTMELMSRELIMGEQPSKKTDIFAIGKSVLELVSGSTGRFGDIQLEDNKLQTDLAKIVESGEKRYAEDVILNKLSELSKQWHTKLSGFASSIPSASKSLRTVLVGMLDADASQRLSIEEALVMLTFKPRQR